jgi:uncharacterized membrane protein
MDDVTLARVLHIVGVVHWIGGLAFVTLVVLPLARSRATGDEGLTLFEAVERRFAAQVRVSVPLVGATGLWMTYYMNLWDRFADPSFWWMSAMLGLWLVFMLLLFVVEPLVHRFRDRGKPVDARQTVGRLLAAHRVLLTLSIATLLGAAAGAHGLALF